jgi:uncharacterized protein YecE (DUF72 family)
VAEDAPPPHGRIAVGTSSWTDPTLTRDTDWYPAKTMSAEDRLKHYASVFPVVEVDATYYAPPAARVAELWAERTPPGFRMDVKAYSLLTQHPAQPKTLWKDLAEVLPEEHRGKRSVYLHHLPDDAVDEVWARFSEALEPLRAAGKLGAVMCQFPPWFTAKRANRDYLAALPPRLPGTRVAVEFRHPSWLADEDEARRTFALLEQLDLAYVCVDEPQGAKSSVPPRTAVTAPLAVVRFHGRNAETWEKKGLTAAERFEYLYDEAELREWVPPIRELAGGAEEVHALFNNCYQDYGVRNAQQLGQLLGEGLQAGAG